MADEYLFPMGVRAAMERVSTLLKNGADVRNRVLDEDDQRVIREALDSLNDAWSAAGFVARRSIPQGEEPAKGAAQGDEPAGCNPEIAGGRNHARSAETRMDAGFAPGGEQGDELPPLPPLPPEIEVGGEGWDIEDFKSWKTFTVDDMEKFAREYGAACRAGGVAEGRAYQHKVEAKIIERRAGEKADARDAARLDFMAENGGAIRRAHDGKRNVAVWTDDYPAVGAGRVANMRKSIDAARSHTGGKEDG